MHVPIISRQLFGSLSVAGGMRGLPFSICFGNEHDLLNSISHGLAYNISIEIYFDSLGFRQFVLHFGFNRDAT